MLSFKKILKYWNATLGNDGFQMDVTELKCEEDNNSMCLFDEAGRVIAEFGPGRQYDGWMLTVEYSAGLPRRWIMSDLSLADKALGQKLEYVILCILVHYDRGFEGSLLDWYVALKPAIPQLTNPRELQGAFQRLSAQGALKLERPKTGADIAADGNDQFPIERKFSTAVIPEGVARWNLNRDRSRL